MSLLERLLAGAIMVKAHVRGYDRRDGKHVDDYERGDRVTPVPAPTPHKVVGAQFGGKTVAQLQAQYGKEAGLFGHLPPPAPPPKKPKAWHPQLDENGEKMPIYHPHKPTPESAWAHGDEVVVTLPGGAVPAQLNGIPFAAWTPPASELAWEDVAGQADIDEPDFHCPKGLHPAAGVVIEEPDGRFWVAAPTNGFGGSPHVFPKGRTDDMPLQATAIKEGFEETGLHAEITGFLGDFTRTQTFTRFYLARRIGGTPAAAGWESQAVLLVPRAKLHQYLTGGANAEIVKQLQNDLPQEVK